jgi:RimJ/RimL family protein N-acetyltransferase
MRFMWERQHQAGLLEWAALHGHTFDYRDPAKLAVAIGIVLANKLAAVAIFHDFRSNVPDIQMTMIAEDPRWCTKGALQFLLAYPFETLGCRRVTALVARKNRRSRRLVEGLGWKLEGTCRRAWDGKQDAMVYGMLREECRWLNVIKVTEEIHGQEQRRVA